MQGPLVTPPLAVCRSQPPAAIVSIPVAATAIALPMAEDTAIRGFVFATMTVSAATIISAMVTPALREPVRSETIIPPAQRAKPAVSSAVFVIARLLPPKPEGLDNPAMPFMDVVRVMCA